MISNNDELVECTNIRSNDNRNGKRNDDDYDEERIKGLKIFFEGFSVGRMQKEEEKKL